MFKKHSIQDALSISLGLSSSFNNNNNNNVNNEINYERSTSSSPHFVSNNRDSQNIDNYLSRSYAGNINLYNNRPSSRSNEQFLSNDKNDEFLDSQSEFIAETDQYYKNSDSSSEINLSTKYNESTNLIPQLHNSSTYTDLYDTNLDIESQPLKSLQKLTNNQTIIKSLKDDFKLQKIISYIPSVILGLLLNILDALSYGMIIFPISEPIFSHLGPAGLSMFYISCIISQLVYSLGGSQFKSAIGSEMIEVTPFFHSMAIGILKELGGNDASPNVVISTTITTFAFSSMVTGLIFLLLGYFKLGQLVSYFPRHILIGCIGGVGYFLIVTGLEISSRLGAFEYSLDYLSQLIEVDNLIKISIPILLTIVLVIVQLLNNHSLILPSFYIAVFILFHVIIIIIPNFDLNGARKLGYLFESSTSDNSKSSAWYEFYKLYDFKIVDWVLVFKQIPDILALTFFGILHVPINIPALAVSTNQESDVNVDKELIAHGLSNLISGAFGSIQNYLVYTNSLLFIRAGADSRIAGIILAIATFGILISGPVIIGFIPICVVGSLIFLLGYELMKEALYDTVGKVNKFEYVTIIIIVLTMGIYDFVYGILAGIVISCFHFIYENTQIPIARNEYTGEIARSTVIRHPLQNKFLNKIGNQIYVMKLQGFLFFGTIGKIETQIKLLFETYNIRYLILDFTNVLNIDFSASEGLNRIKNFMFDQTSFLIIALGDSKILKSLEKVGLFNRDLNLKIFKDLNSSLEWCENEFLLKYKEFKTTNSHSIKSKQKKSKQLNNLPINTPRNTKFFKEASNFLQTENQLVNTISLLDNKSSLPNDSNTSPQSKVINSDPLNLFLFSIQQICKNLSQSHWSPIASKFVKKTVFKDQRLEVPRSFVILMETGSLSINYQFKNFNYSVPETLLSRTLFGKIDMYCNHTSYHIELIAKRDSTLWLLDDDALHWMRSEKLEQFNEILLILNKLNEDRFESITGFTLMSA
ncbi:hypothetical protein WICMUC_004970 [Wickerhamomyces mucosus]|uniref:STAS domain-containing protein n=1 Tax=Wickerhamomyces mucosus TaxID=1378264 RepID=A0A9P8PC51_9ASCO|nr:hypothetical protein WICMUC_004970 [Wickerhamomyces mucosus]